MVKQKSASAVLMLRWIKIKIKTEQNKKKLVVVNPFAFLFGHQHVCFGLREEIILSVLYIHQWTPERASYSIGGNLIPIISTRKHLTKLSVVK